MPTERCTYLIVKGIYYNLSEMWIAQQPVLLFAYVFTYMPFVARKISNAMGAMKVKELKNSV
jgi:dehydrogenase/reductase SDR family protein 7